MSPDRIRAIRSESALPQESSEDSATRRARTSRHVAVIVFTLAVISLLHFVTPMSDATIVAHLLYRRLYYVPIVYAAWFFGKRGGLPTSLFAIALFAAHAQIVPHRPVMVEFDNWFLMATFLLAGLLFGHMRDVEVAHTNEFQRVSSQLEDAYRKLEGRAIQFINVQDYMSSILRSITAAVMTVGPDGSVATANPAAERMLGMSEFEMVPRGIGAIFREDDGLESDVTKVLSGRLPRAQHDARLVTVTGREIHVTASVSRMRAVAGTVLGAVVTLEDTSSVRALTDQLIRADRLAAMGELTAGVAHEVRNPLGIIRASVQLLEDAQCDPVRIEEAATVIKQEIDRLDKVIKALLDFGRPSRPTLVVTGLDAILEDVVLFTTRFAKQADVTIDMELAEDLPPIEGDPDQLKQVFLNLVTNAVQAMADTGGRISIHAESENDYLVVSVADTGPGISAEDLQKIYDPFFTRRSEGTGLGLTIVHRIIDEHGGHIEAESSPDGTTFTVSLPAVYEE